MSKNDVQSFSLTNLCPHNDRLSIYNCKPHVVGSVIVTVLILCLNVLMCIKNRPTMTETGAWKYVALQDSENVGYSTVKLQIKKCVYVV